MIGDDLYTIEGPVCAVESGGSRKVSVCSRCGRGQREQVADLRVSLVCRSRSVWLSDGNAILVDYSIAEWFSRITWNSVDFRPAIAAWRSGLPWSHQQPPSLIQLVVNDAISAASSNVECGDCSCGAVRSISFAPLVVSNPEKPSMVWHLFENPEVLIFHSDACDVLLEADADLELQRVWREGEFRGQTDAADGIDWSEL